MDIFTGIEILFFVLGALSVLLACGVVRLKRRFSLSLGATALAGLGAFLIVFCVAWSASSIIEGEPQAANMGILIFGVPILVTFGVLRRLILRTQQTA
jgi:multisubunit Na+/H+ antiporter MnhG subunit